MIITPLKHDHKSKKKRNYTLFFRLKIIMISKPCAGPVGYFKVRMYYYYFFQYGFNLVFASSQAINSIALSLNHRSLRTKALVLELLAAVCLVSGGHHIICKSFDHFQEVINIIIFDHFQYLLHFILFSYRICFFSDDRGAYTIWDDDAVFQTLWWIPHRFHGKVFFSPSIESTINYPNPLSCRYSLAFATLFMWSYP